jgi:hypothetical protein
MGVYKEAWGYSKIACFKECEKKFEFQYVQKIPSGGSAAMDRGADMHKACEAYLNGWDKTLDPTVSNWQEQLDDLRTRGVIAERAWGFNREWKLLPTWFGKDCWLRAKSDAHYIDGSTIVVIDFKSGKFKIPPIDQIELYAICAHAVYPEATHVRAEFWFLDHLLLLREKYEQMVQPMYDAEVFEPSPSRDCAWCNYSKTKDGACDAG